MASRWHQSIPQAVIEHLLYARYSSRYIGEPPTTLQNQGLFPLLVPRCTFLALQFSETQHIVLSNSCQINDLKPFLCGLGATILLVTVSDQPILQGKLVLNDLML